MFKYPPGAGLFLINNVIEQETAFFPVSYHYHNYYNLSTYHKEINKSKNRPGMARLKKHLNKLVEKDIFPLVDVH